MDGETNVKDLKTVADDGGNNASAVADNNTSAVADNNTSAVADNNASATQEVTSTSKYTHH